jgi:putative addiction module killer protein
MNNDTYEIEVYCIEGEVEPFTEWLHALKDSQTQRTVLLRIQRIRLGNLGDSKALKGTNGLHELRIDYGPGLRVYFAQVDKKIVLLLGGGDKSSQRKDINRCTMYWQAYKEKMDNEKKS